MTTTKRIHRIRAAARRAGMFFLLATSSPGLQLVQFDVDSTSSPSHFLVVIDIRNTDTGWTYLFSDLHILSELADEVWSLPHVQAMFSSKSAMWNQWGKAMLGYEVDYGWTAQTSGPDGSVSFTRNNGIPGFDYDIWFNSSISPGQDEVRYRVVIPKSHLDHDGDGWSASDPGDYLLKVDLNRPVAVAATADSGSMPFAGIGFAYSAIRVAVSVPAPPSVELLVGAGGALSLLVSDAAPGAQYEIEKSLSLLAGTWESVVSFTATASLMEMPLPANEGESTACYRASAVVQ